MAAKLGESFQREWDADPFPDELWDAVTALRDDRPSGLSMLAALAERGSALAMMYLGDALSVHGDKEEQARGETWLARSAQAGSVEGRYQLAYHYYRQGCGEQAAAELKTLAAQGYGPAMYALGRMLFEGDLVSRDVQEALIYLRMAKAVGHLPSIGLLSRLYRKEDFGVRGRVASHWLCLAKIPALIWYVLRYPESDRLRGLALRTAE